MDSYVLVSNISTKKMEYEKIQEFCKKEDIDVPETVTEYLKNNNDSQELATLDAYYDDAPASEIKAIKYISSQAVEIDIKELMNQNVKKIKVELFL